MNNKDLIELTEFIIQKYHNPLRENLPKIHLLFNKIVDVHWDIHPEFAKMKDIFILFQNEMLKHLDKEEKILFPMMQALQKAVNEKKNIWAFHCGSIKNPITQMEKEHKIFDFYLEQIKELSNNFFIPENACNAYTTTYTMLKNLYDETLEHAHFEDNTLHKLALEYEKIIF